MSQSIIGSVTVSLERFKELEKAETSVSEIINKAPFAMYIYYNAYKGDGKEMVILSKDEAIEQLAEKIRELEKNAYNHNIALGKLEVIEKHWLFKKIRKYIKGLYAYK